MKHIIINSLVLMAFMASAYAQNVNLVDDNYTLSPSEKETLTIRIKEKITDFMRYQRDMAIKGDSISFAVKQHAKKKALELFHGQGDPYMDWNPRSNSLERNSGVKMWTIQSKTRPGDKKSTLMKTPPPGPPKRRDGYFDQLIYRSQQERGRYKQIVIEQADAVRVDSFTKVGENRYEAVAYVVQRFCGYGGDGFKVLYEDHTLKRFKITITAEEIMLEDGTVGVWWQMVLGDIHADDIW